MSSQSCFKCSIHNCSGQTALNLLTLPKQPFSRRMLQLVVAELRFGSGRLAGTHYSPATSSMSDSAHFISWTVPPGATHLYYTCKLILIHLSHSTTVTLNFWVNSLFFPSTFILLNYAYNSLNCGCPVRSGTAILEQLKSKEKGFTIRLEEMSKSITKLKKL